MLSGVLAGVDPRVPEAEMVLEGTTCVEVTELDKVEAAVKEEERVEDDVSEDEGVDADEAVFDGVCVIVGVARGGQGPFREGLHGETVKQRK